MRRKVQKSTNSAEKKRLWDENCTKNGDDFSFAGRVIRSISTCVSRHVVYDRFGDVNIEKEMMSIDCGYANCNLSVVRGDTDIQ